MPGLVGSRTRVPPRPRYGRRGVVPVGARTPRTTPRQSGPLTALQEAVISRITVVTRPLRSTRTKITHVSGVECIASFRHYEVVLRRQPGARPVGEATVSRRQHRIGGAPSPPFSSPEHVGGRCHVAGNRWRRPRVPPHDRSTAARQSAGLRLEPSASNRAQRRTRVESSCPASTPFPQFTETLVVRGFAVRPGPGASVPMLVTISMCQFPCRRGSVGAWPHLVGAGGPAADPETGSRPRLAESPADHARLAFNVVSLMPKSISWINLTLYAG